MAGPWFTVQESSEDWKEISKIWISNGETDCKGKIDVRVRLMAEGDAVDSGGPPELTEAE